ncbi:hypothetical protein D3C77_777150 [compost metagenome]
MGIGSRCDQQFNNIGVQAAAIAENDRFQQSRPTQVIYVIHCNAAVQAYPNSS